MCRACWGKRQTRQAAERRAAKDAATLGTPKPAAPPEREPLTSYDEARRLWEQSIGLSRDRYAGPCERQFSPDPLRVVVLSDVHAPFMARDILAEIVTRTRHWADLCIVGGDLADCYSVSRFIKYEPVGFAEEWADVQATLEMLSESYPRVRVVIGNHDARLEKQILERCTADQVAAVRWMTGGSLCPLTMLCKRYPNVEIAPHATGDGHHMDWMTTLGDALVSHAEKYSRVPGSALRSVEEWIEDQAQSFDLSGYRLILQAHTHQMGMFPWRSGKLLVETGCVASTQGYMTTPRIGGRPQRRGFTTFTQHNGVTDLNSVRQWCADLVARVA